MNSKEIGETFEYYLRHLFHPLEFTREKLPPKKEDGKSTSKEEEKKPDFKFTHRDTEHSFWVEAKYKSDIHKGKLRVCKKHKYDRYKKFQKSVSPEKVFIVVGHKGEPYNPEILFVFDIEKMKHATPYEHMLENRGRNPRKLFQYEPGELI